MFPKIHIIAGAIISILIYLIFPITPLETLTIFLSSFLIDFDHYLLYTFKFKNISLKNSVRYFFNHRTEWLKILNKERNKYKRNIFFLHSIEAWIVLLILSLLHPIFYFILIGFAIHMLLDYTEIIQLREYSFQKISVILTLIDNRKKKTFQPDFQHQEN